MALSPSQLSTLSLLAEDILEGAPGALESRPELVARCAARLHTLPRHRQLAIGTALDLLGSSAASLLAGGPCRPLARHSAAQRRRCLAAWTDSALPPLRAAWHAVRRLVLAVHYGRPEVAAAIGYDGRFQERRQFRPFEGPLPERPGAAADEPVARGRVRLPGALPPEPLPAGVYRGTTLTGDLARRADVVVIGTGAGGAVTAATLAEAGYEVVMLESGPWVDRADFTERDDALTERLFAEGGLRTTDDGGVSLLQGGAVGGGSTVNWMIMLRTPDYVLEQWAREAGTTGMLPADMAPVFAQVERDVHAGLVPDDAHSANNQLLWHGARALGWRVRSGMINARHCVRCGFCSFGCRHDAKQSVLRTYLPRAAAAGASLYTDVAVARIDVLERDTGRGTPPCKRVHAQTSQGTRVTVDAPVVVVAAGAVGTPVLLQRSGLGGGGVGQWLRLHPTVLVYGIYDRDIVPSTGIPLTTMCDEFIRWRGTDYGFWIETPPMHPAHTATVMPGVGRLHAAAMTRLNRQGVFIGLTRDGAARDVSSGRVTVNRRGETSIRYRLTPEDEQRVRASMVAMGQLHLAMGARAAETAHATPLVARSTRDVAALGTGSMRPNELALLSAHVNGTCRMGTTVSTSGATPDGERHGVRGLYITDGSLLPTALGVNPQATIMAVAQLLATRMSARHRGVQQ